MADEIFDLVIENCSFDVKNSLSLLPNIFKKNIEEIRLRVNCPLSIYSMGRDYFVSKDGGVFDDPKDGLMIDYKQINKTFQILCNYSIYALAEEVKKGFITIKGG